jgi:serine protease inhibitor
VVIDLKKTILPSIIVSFLLVATGCGIGNQQGSLEIASHVDFGKDDYKKIVSYNNQLGLELLSKVESNGDGNSFLSPTSLFMALSMVYNGTDGITKEEIARVLHAEGIDVIELNKANASLMSKLHSNSKQNQLKVANSIWLNEDYHFQTNFAEDNRDYFNAKIQEVDISDSQSTKMINDWVEKSTNNKITDMVESPLDPNLVALLLNAIYFKGKWTHEFDKKQTENRTFYMKDGSTKEVPLMMLNEKLAYWENENFQAVSLPYGEEEMSMKVFLPKENLSLDKFQTMLTLDNWEKWNSEFQEKEGKVMLPRFKLEYEFLLNDTLKELGMTTAFDTGANFSRMIEENEALSISRVKQKTFIEVNEEGTEAAAATSVEIVKKSASLDKPFHMEINRPFFIVITDNETGTILFLGSISNP